MLTCAFVRSKAWFAARMPLRLARLPRAASSAQRSRRLRSMRAAAPVLLAHAEVTEIIILFHLVQNLGIPRYMHELKGLACSARVTPASSHARPRHSRHLRSTLVVAPVLFAHAAVAEAKNEYIRQPYKKAK